MQSRSKCDITRR